MEIREARDSDASAVTQLLAEAYPNMVVTPASWLHRRRTEPARARPLHLVAEAGGQVVARAQAALNVHTTATGAAFGGVIVDPSYRRRGIGTALLGRLADHVRSYDATTWTGVIFVNDASAAFARHHGFSEERVAVVSAVDPRSVVLPLPPSVEVLTAGALGPKVVFEIDSAGALDEPLPNPPAPMPYDEWLSDIWDEPSFTSEGSFVTISDGTPAALALLYAAPEFGRAVNAFTATIPEFRGRGLALAAKIATMRWAAAHGITRVWTANDDTNAPMLAINARLGYRPEGRLMTVRNSV